MSHSIHIPADASGKAGKYRQLIPQLHALVEGETDLVANISNIMAALREGMGFFWVGVYFVRAEELVLGPFQGTVACTRIAYGKGVCGYAWKEARTIVVPDVDDFPGHIACSSLSRSEIVVPVFCNDRVVMVLDVDSDRLSAFDQDDVDGLEEVAALLGTIFSKIQRS